MPNYSFRDKRNNDIQVLDMPMAEREPWLEANPDWEQVFLKVCIADPLMLGHLPAHAKDFQRNVLGRMAKSIPGNNIEHQMRRFGRTTEI